MEQIEEGVNGFLVEVGNSQQMAERIVEVLQDDVLRSPMGAAGRKTALRSDDNICTDRLLELLHQLVKETARQPVPA